MCVFAVLSCLFALTFFADNEFENGIYEVVSEQNAKVTMHVGEREVHLGNRVDFESNNISIWSETNNNDQFGFCLRGCRVEQSNSKMFAIVTNGKCFSLSASQSPKGGSIDFDFWGKTNTADDAKSISKFLNTDITLNKHPGHQLQTALRPTKESFKVGQKMPLEIEITNVGNSPVYFMNGGQQRGPRNNQFRFIAFSAKNNGKAIADTGDPLNFGGLAAFVTLKPGETFKHSADLANWFEISTPDSLHVTGLFELVLMNKDHEHTGPRWRDFAVGECTVQIKGDE